MKEIYNSWEVDTSERIIDLTKNGKVSYEKKHYAKCLNCGTEGHIVRYRDVKNGKSKRCKSCGIAKRNFKHGEAKLVDKTKLYSIWMNMRDRCNNELNKAYKYYGGAGVTVCSEWDDYIAFKEWSLSNGYVEGFSIDKDTICEEKHIEPKIYGPDTCLWMSRSDNAKECRTRDCK